MKKEKIVLFVAVVAGVFALGKVTFAPRTINIQEYVDARVSGINGKGTLECEIEDYFPKELEVKLKASKTKNLKNGDVITFDVSCNDEKAKEYGITFTDKQAKWKISGLEDYSTENGDVKEGHNFYALTDMNDEMTEVLFNTVKERVQDEVNFENELGHSELSIKEGRIIGIYADNDTGYGSDVLTEFTFINGNKENKVYFCFDFIDLKNYVTGSNIKTFNNEECLDALEYKTENHLGKSTFYSESKDEVDALMKESGLLFTEYAYPQ